MTTRKPTADERDRAIVAKGRPWVRKAFDNRHPSVWSSMWRDENILSERECERIALAAARILNRIVREEAKRKGKR